MMCKWFSGEGGEQLGHEALFANDTSTSTQPMRTMLLGMGYAMGTTAPCPNLPYPSSAGPGTVHIVSGAVIDVGGMIRVRKI